MNHRKWRQHLALAVLGLTPFLVLAAVHWSDLPAAQGGDYAQYLLHARAIVEGRPYGDIGYLFTAYNPLIGPRAQLPGWPVLLAPGVAVFGTSLAFPKILVILSAAGFLSFVVLRLDHEDERWMAIATAAIVGVSLESTFATNSALSDLPFACTLWALFWIADRPGSWSWARAAAVGVLGTFAMTTRILGVAVVPGLAYLAMRRPRDDRTKILVPAIVWAATGLAALLLLGARIPFLAQTFRSPEIMISRFRNVWPRTRYSIMESMMYPFPWDVVNDAYHAAGIVLAIIGVVAVWRRVKHSMLGGVTVVYLAGVVFAPVFDIRYLWPVWPLIVYAMLTGARTVLRWVRVKDPLRTRLLVSGVSLLVLVAIAVAWRKPAPPALLDQPGVRDLFRWLRTVDGADSMRVVFASPRVLTLETGVPAMGPFVTTAEESFREFERGRITHVIVGDAQIQHRAVQHLRPFVDANRGAFDLIYENGGFAVYRLLSPQRSSAGPPS